VVSDQPDKVRVGSWVRIRDGELEEGWRIVPHLEADTARGLISENCPLAKALLGCRVGEQVPVYGPGGRRPVTLLSVGDWSLGQL
jgi:transcription elongation GreA/GreB family factor